jgi:cytochrome c
VKRLKSIGAVFAAVSLAAAALAQVSDVNPKAELKRSVERGKALFSDESLGTGAMSCNDCHLEGGTKDGAMGNMPIRAFHSLAAEYPKFFKMANRVMTLDQVVNWCILTPMKGTPLEWDDQRLADLVAYTASVRGERTERPEKEAQKGK